MPEPRFETMSSKAYQAHIVLSWPMTTIVKQDSSRGTSPTFPSSNLHFKPTFGSLTLCRVLSSGRQRKIQHSDQSFISSSCQRRTAPGLPKSRCFDSSQQMTQELAADPVQPAKPTTAVFPIQTALPRANLRKSHHPRQLF